MTFTLLGSIILFSLALRVILGCIDQEPIKQPEAIFWFTCSVIISTILFFGSIMASQSEIKKMQ